MSDGLKESLNQVTKTSGIFRFGTGILGRSAVVLAVLFALFSVVAWKVHSEILLVGLVLLAVGVFFVWFFKMLTFAKSDPAAALLEGAEWRKFQTFEPSSKGHLPDPAEQAIVPAPKRRKRVPKTIEVPPASED